MKTLTDADYEKLKSMAEYQIPIRPEQVSDGDADGLPVYEWHCPRCRAEIDEGVDMFCPVCGQRIDWGENEETEH